MSRRKPAVKRQILPDPVYQDVNVAAFINVIMRSGKKTIAQKIMYAALSMLVNRLKKEKVKEKDEDADSGIDSDTDSSSGSSDTRLKRKKQSLSVPDVLEKILSNVSPTVEVKSRRVGGTTYQVPVEVAVRRALALAMRWITEAAKKRIEKTMALRLTAELYDAYFGKGASIKKRDDVHRMAKANQAFAGYRW